MTTDLINFLTQNKDSLIQHCQSWLNVRFGNSTEEWVDWLLESFFHSLKGEEYNRCKFVEAGYAQADSIQILDEAALVIRSFVFESIDQVSHFGAWSELIDRSFIKMRQRCLNAALPEVASALFSDVQLIRLLNQISQDMLQKHTEAGIFDVISEGLSKFGLFIAVFKISPDCTLGELHFASYSNEVNRYFIKTLGIEKSVFYQFEIPNGSRLSAVIRNQDTAAFFPNDELITCLFKSDQQMRVKQFQKMIGSTKTILASGVVNNQLKAVLVVSGDQLTEKEVPTISIFANQMAIAMQNADLYHRIQESESRFRTFYERAEVGISIYDWRKKMWEPTPAFIKMLGYDQADYERFKTFDIKDIKHPEDWKHQKNTFDDLNSGKIKVYENESRYIKKDGHVIWAKIVVSVVRDIETEKPVYTIVILEDITERKKIEAAVLESQQKYKTLFDVSVDAIFIMDKEGVIQDANPAAVKMLGLSDEEIKNRSFLSFLPKEDEQEFELLGKRLMYLDIEHLQTRFKTANGAIIDVEINTRTMELKENVLQVIVRDITEQRNIQRELQYIATHDMLTGLFNRNYFEIEMSRYSNGRMYPISIIVIDVDGLKAANDIKGHTAGDMLLHKTAKVLRSVFRSEDIVARWGGDEFAILLPLVDKRSAKVIVDRIRAELELINRDILDPADQLSFSIGNATANHGEDLYETIKQADSAMYQEKRFKRSQNAMIKREN
jgi:diguanylate cyclase (GGDEF)-like protein/PAS domain S-box-containing protein